MSLTRTLAKWGMHERKQRLKKEVLLPVPPGGGVRGRRLLAGQVTPLPSDPVMSRVPPLPVAL